MDNGGKSHITFFSIGSLLGFLELKIDVEVKLTIVSWQDWKWKTEHFLKPKKVKVAWKSYGFQGNQAQTKYKGSELRMMPQDAEYTPKV